MKNINRLLFLLLLFLFFFSLCLVCCNENDNEILIYDDVEDEENDEETMHIFKESIDEKENEKWNFMQLQWVGQNETLFYTKILIFVVAFLVAAINGYWGKKINRKIAVSWLRCCKDIFSLNFAKIGNDKSFLLEKSYHSYEFFSTGRKNCNYYIINLNLIERQCIWRYCYYYLFTERKDTMMIQINFERLDKAILCIYKKKKKKAIDTHFPNLMKYTNAIEKKELNPAYDIRADSLEVADLVIGGKIMHFLNNYDQYINFICITDIPLSDEEMERSTKSKNQNIDNNGDRHNNHTEEEETKKENCNCYLEIVIPDNTEELRDLIFFSIFMIDACHCIDISDRVRENVKRLRTLIENADEKRKQEIKELEEKKKAKRLQLEKEKFESMTAQQQRKYEEKKQKKSLKKNKKIKIIKM